MNHIDSLLAGPGVNQLPAYCNYWRARFVVLAARVRRAWPQRLVSLSDALLMGHQGGKTQSLAPDGESDFARLVRFMDEVCAER
jgi:hypothetical protein